ncbi:hypothetical protein RvY_11576 [Ramazzottius varieornatus]|uniref:Centrosomal protein of 44 kDa n=1 Tax=Ramazzottius varieornatus TaxID=947166 RepID=A0A1D1VGJ8_RAMVA|nr:hypothetical protein RvY_11576 [Ramazzottius varieornatus]
MSTSSDSCDYQIRLESSRLLPVFEELQAVGFPVTTLEAKLDKLKKGGPCICFQIYLYLYKTFRRLFDEKEVYLDQYILNDKVIDREGFARRFFSCLRQIIGHDQALPLYQYVCPGHPLSKVEEIADIAHELRSLWKSQKKLNESKDRETRNDGEGGGREKVGRIVERLHDSFSSNKSLYGSSLNDRDRSYSQPMRPASITAPDGSVPWRVVKETAVRAGATGSGEDGGSDEEEVSADEGIERSWNASSSLNRELFDTQQDSNLGPRLEVLRSTMPQANRNGDDGLTRTVLDRLISLESHQNIQFRSIEDRLIKIERELTDHNVELDRSIIKRLDTHQSRLDYLERHSTKPPRGRHRHTSADKCESTDQEVPVRQLSAISQSQQQRARSPSTDSAATKPKPSDSDNEPSRGRNSKPPSRVMSMSRSYSHDQRMADLQREVAQIEKVNSELLRDSGFSSVQKLQKDEPVSDKETGEVSAGRYSEGKEEETSMRRSSSYFEPVTTNEAVNRSNQPQTSTQTNRNSEDTRSISKQLLRELNSPKAALGFSLRNSRSQSVAPHQSRLISNDNQLSGSRKQLANDDMILMDLNERIQLRLEERIRTAEDTLKACMETIRKDYVLVRRHP